jgi:hypothetical protein
MRKVSLRIGAAALLGSLAVTAAAACSFPEVTYIAPDDGAAGDDPRLATLPDSDATSDSAIQNSDGFPPEANPPGDVGLPDADAVAATSLSDAAPRIDVADAEAALTMDAATTLPAETGQAEDAVALNEAAPSGIESGPTPTSCDADNDGYASSNGACGGLDCDDNDSRANPGVMQFQTFMPTATTQGDWNCDGTVEKAYAANVACDQLDVGVCDTALGFVGDPPCGSAGTLVQCGAVGRGVNRNGNSNRCAVLLQLSTLQACR